MFTTVFSIIFAVYFLGMGALQVKTGKAIGEERHLKSYTRESVTEYAKTNGKAYLIIGLAEAVIAIVKMILINNKDLEVALDIVFVLPVLASVVVSTVTAKKLVKKDGTAAAVTDNAGGQGEKQEAVTVRRRTGRVAKAAKASSTAKTTDGVTKLGRNRGAGKKKLSKEDAKLMKKAQKLAREAQKEGE